MKQMREERAKAEQARKMEEREAWSQSVDCCPSHLTILLQERLDRMKKEWEEKKRQEREEMEKELEVIKCKSATDQMDA